MLTLSATSMTFCVNSPALAPMGLKNSRMIGSQLAMCAPKALSTANANAMSGTSDSSVAYTRPMA